VVGQSARVGTQEQTEAMSCDRNSKDAETGVELEAVTRGYGHCCYLNCYLIKNRRSHGSYHGRVFII